MRIAHGTITAMISEKCIASAMWLSLIGILVLAHVASAQSGRRQAEKPSVVVAPTPSPSPTEQVEQPRITSLIIGGMIVHDFDQFKSTYLNHAIKQLDRELRSEPRPFKNVIRAGKMNADQANDRSAAETTGHLLWLEIVITDAARADVRIAEVNFVVLLPKTSRSLFSGKVTPGPRRVVAQGGVLTIPSTAPPIPTLQLDDCMQQIANRLKKTGWLVMN